MTTEQKIERVKQERLRLAKAKKQLEAQLGSIGKALRKLDTSLIAARKASRDAYEKVLATDQQLVALKRKSKRLEHEISALKKAVLDQAIAAWQRGSHTSAWMGVLTGVSVSDIPHRRFLLHDVMRSEEHDRRAYADAVSELASVKIQLQAQRQQLELFRQEKKKTAVELSLRLKDKRKIIDRVRHEVRLKKRKDSRLAREEKALMQMLDSINEDLLVIDRQQSGLSVRKRKGRLKWPIRGRIVASYRSRPKASMSRLQGVQLRPKNHTKAVRAMAAGQVRYADWFGGYGLMTIVDYGDGLLGVYAHNDVLYKQLGDWIEEGEILADAGSTGWVNKVTLYFEIRDRGKAVNPKRWCRR
ncbi:MAG: peptidoglycan DD-metalloendopeptidase family protein [Mariprofundus sp.]|nr:peptidoglycan DD-metalloendopeptidase family protein [Mariprofundus sp.]